jgi:hypothetical protein
MHIICKYISCKQENFFSTKIRSICVCEKNRNLSNTVLINLLGKRQVYLQFYYCCISIDIFIFIEVRGAQNPSE